jgi:hypothetical protein
MREKALKWLYDWLRKKRVALGWAEYKPNVQKEEIENLNGDIEVVEWIIGKVLEGEDDNV